MTTGDMKNNLKKLQKQASLIRYPHDLDYEGLTKGDVRAHLPILYHAFFDCNSQVLESLIKMNYNLAGKKDASFMNMVYKVLREKGANCDMKLKVGQFMSTGFAERKVIMTTSIIEFVRKYFKFSAGKTKSKSTVVHSNHATDVQIPSIVAPDCNAEPREIPPPDTQQCATITAPRMQSTVRGDLSFMPLPGFGTSAIAPLESTIVQRHIACDAPSKTNTVKHDTPQEVISRVTTAQQPTETIDESEEEDLEDFASQLVTMRIRQDALEKENLALKTTIESMKKEILILSKEFRAFEERPQHVQSEEAMARLDIIESKIAVIENNASNHPPHSPVCGFSLCSNMKNLNIQQTPADVSQVMASNERSLLDVTNDSPMHPIRMQERKLFKSVQITRTLLGMGDVSGIDSTTHSDIEQEENKIPEEQSISGE